MNTPAAFRATYADWKLIKTRGVVQVVFEVPLADHKEVLKVLGGMPDVARERWFGIAPIDLSQTRKEAMPNKPLSGLDAARPQPDDSKQLAGAKRPWETFEPAQQAGIRSNDIRFVQFLEEEYRDIWREHQDAAECIRSICEVRSRAELGTDQRKRVLWNQLDRHYQAWDAKVRLNA